MDSLTNFLILLGFLSALFLALGILGAILESLRPLVDWTVRLVGYRREVSCKPPNSSDGHTVANPESPVPGSATRVRGKRPRRRGPDPLLQMSLPLTMSTAQAAGGFDTEVLCR